MADPVVHITNGVPDSGTGNITTIGAVVDALAAPLPLPTGAATSAKQDTGNTALASIAQSSQAITSSALFTSVTPSDSTVLTAVRALYVGGAGVVVATNSAGNDVSFTVVAGTTLVISPTKVKAASTATLIVALF